MEKKKGLLIEYNDEGKLIKEIRPLQSKLVKGTDGFLGFRERRYYDNGNIESEVVHSNKLQEFKFFYESGQLYFFGHIYSQVWNKVGKWTYWYEDGKVSKEIFYHDSIPNLKVGTWQYWDEQGNLRKEEVYEAGELIDTREYMPAEKKQ